MRAIIIGLLASAATVTAEIGARELLVLREEHTAAAPQRETEARKTHEINVPRIKDGSVKGYAVMLLSYTVDVSALKGAAMAPDSILVDEAFRYVYNDDTIDFDHMDRFDFAKMGKALIHAVNTRVKGASWSTSACRNSPTPRSATRAHGRELRRRSDQDPAGADSAPSPRCLKNSRTSPIESLRSSDIRSLASSGARSRIASKIARC
jgi:hypothetical protein